MCDFLNRPLAPGQQIVWPGRAGSKCWMNVGTIKQVLEGELIVNRVENGHSRQVRLKKMSTVCILGAAA